MSEQKRPMIKYPVDEEDHQKIVIAWAMVNAIKYPELLWLHHIPNGTHIGGDARWAVGKNNKQMGVKPGIPDLFLPCIGGKSREFGGLYIEMKKPGGLLSEHQIKFKDFISNNHFILCFTCFNFKHAIETIKSYLGNGEFKSILVEGVEY